MRTKSNKKSKCTRNRPGKWKLPRNKRTMVFWKISKGKIPILKHRHKNKIFRQRNNKTNRKRMGKPNMLYGTQIPTNETNDTTKKHNRSNK